MRTARIRVSPAAGSGSLPALRYGDLADAAITANFTTRPRPGGPITLRLDVKWAGDALSAGGDWEVGGACLASSRARWDLVRA